MARPTECMPSALRDCLDAAREFLRVEFEWVEKGNRRCFGCAFGFWCVRAGPDGWQHRPPTELTPGRQDYGPCLAPCSVEWTDLAATITKALDLAERWLPPDARAAGGAAA